MGKKGKWAKVVNKMCAFHPAVFENDIQQLITIHEQAGVL